MRKIAVTLLAFGILVALPLQAAEWTGWITDEHCGAKGASEGHQSCALKCADDGAALVLYNPADKQLYQLSDQAAAKKHVGHKVKVVGTVEGSTITVESIAEQKSDS
jgi:hypothetical protein